MALQSLVFLNQDTEGINFTGEKIGNLDYIKINNFCSSKYITE